MVSDLVVYFFILGPSKNMCCFKLYCYTQIHKNDKFVKFAPRMYFSLLLQFLKCPEWLCLWFVFIVLFLFYCHMVLVLAFQLFVNHTQVQDSVDLRNIVKLMMSPFKETPLSNKCLLSLYNVKFVSMPLSDKHPCLIDAPMTISPQIYQQITKRSTLKHLVQCQIQMTTQWPWMKTQTTKLRFETEIWTSWQHRCINGSSRYSAIYKLP